MAATCPDCGAAIHQQHRDGCDVARCVRHGYQLLSCPGPGPHGWAARSDTWSGFWPGELECMAYGFYAKPNPNGPGWVPCEVTEPGAVPDLNRLYREGRWDTTTRRWMVD
jgi:hypothetical protein